MDTKSTETSAEDELAIRDLVARAHELQSDPVGLPELHTAETVIVNIAGRRVVGRETFAEAMSVALGTALSDVRTTVDVERILLVTPDVAVVSCVKSVHDGRASGDNALPSTGALTYVVRRTDAGWRIALAQTTPIL